MKKQEAFERIQKLRKLINYHRYLYHVLDKQEISDAALDSLKKELFDLEEKFPEFKTPTSPTQRIGGKPLPEFKKIHHKIQMLSLHDAFTKEDIYNWQKRIKNFLRGSKYENFKISYYSEIKMDGLAIKLVYKRGKLIIGATRGDGIKGEDVTQNIKTIETIPLEIHILERKEITEMLKEIDIKKEQLLKKIKDLEIEIRGEVYIEKKEFEKINQIQRQKGLPEFANPRNLASGSVRQLDPKITASRKLKFMAYDIVTDLGQDTHQKTHLLLKILGFKTNNLDKLCNSIDEVIEHHNKISKIRDKLQYWTDGMVVNINEIEIFKFLGIVGKGPRGAIAYKFPPEEATTQILDIVVQVGRTGKLTPVAILKPVYIAGTTISRATLHNEDEIKKLGVKIKDTVIVKKAGDIIPEVVKVLPELRTGKEIEFKMPEKCPFCESPVVKKQGEVDYYCSNKNCYAQSREKIKHFVSKVAFDIQGLGDKIVDQLIEAGLIEDPADIFSLKKGDLLNLEGFAEKKVENLLSAINNSKEITLDRFLFALGIRYVGEQTAQLIANWLYNKVKSPTKSKDYIEYMKNVSLDELSSLQDIGPIVAESIYNFFRDKKNLKLIYKLFKNGVRIKRIVLKRDSKIKGKVFIFTGTLDSMTRDEAKKKIRELGGEVVSSISKRVDFVVCGENPGSKYKKAKKLGLKIINEKEFLNMIS